ncbi:MAG: urease accessory protein UreF [Proteobacteria bacterium]|nr:urease accessory protein UreF [Pseudomonadota bacterium]
MTTPNAEPTTSFKKKGGGSGRSPHRRARAAARSRSKSLANVDPRLLVWLSPSFPVGAFAYSHGLEWAAGQSLVHDRATLEAWLVDLVELGSLRNDLIFVAAAWHAVVTNDAKQLIDLNDLALALQPSAERHLESVTQGTSFVRVMRDAWPTSALAPVTEALAEAAANPIAVGACTAAHGIALPGTLLAYAIAFATNLTSAAIRLSVVGQTDAQRVLATHMPRLDAAARAAETHTLDDLGGATLRSDLASLAHETQYTRLFRS